MPESVQIRAGQIGFSLLRMITRKNRCLFPRPRYAVYDRSTNMAAAKVSAKFESEAWLHLNLEHSQLKLWRPFAESPSSCRFF